MERELFSLNNEGSHGPVADTVLDGTTPLPHRIRPKKLDDFYGQAHLLDDGKLLKRIIVSDRPQSAIFYGPAGSGKTTLAHIIARMTRSCFVQVNAVSSNSNELRSILQTAQKRKRANSQNKTILFVDEIHRFNKAQQDILMPAVESGDIILIGATTHNPSFSVIGPLLSRSMLFELKPLSVADLLQILRRAITDAELGFGALAVDVSPEALEHIAVQSSGDARRALIALEIAINSTDPGSDGTIRIDMRAAEESIQKKVVQYDKDGDYHYDTISAFIKSMRGSDPDATLYWLAKMIEAGEDPLFIIRRMIILASEDIGNADPHALQIATSALRALECVGMPEGRLILAQAALYMATAPKSNAVITAIDAAIADVKNGSVEEVPAHLKDAHYRRAKDLGRGQGYKYPHAYAGNHVAQSYKHSDKQYYFPTENGYEKNIKQRQINLRSTSNKG
jgi:putative ATPase